MDLTYAGRAEAIKTQLSVMRNEFSRVWQELRGGEDLPLEELVALYDLQNRITTTDMSELYSGVFGGLVQLNGIFEQHLQAIDISRTSLVQPDEGLEREFAEWEAAIGEIVEFNDAVRPKPDGTLFYHALKAYLKAGTSYQKIIRGGTVQFTAEEAPYFELNRMLSVLSSTASVRDKVSAWLPNCGSCDAQAAS